MLVERSETGRVGLERAGVRDDEVRESGAGLGLTEGAPAVVGDDHAPVQVTVSFAVVPGPAERLLVAATRIEAAGQAPPHARVVELGGDGVDGMAPRGRHRAAAHGHGDDEHERTGEADELATPRHHIFPGIIGRLAARPPSTTSASPLT